MKPPHQPPRWADRLLDWFCAPHLLEEIVGDLHERYYRRTARLGEKQARQIYWREVLSYLRPSVFHRKSSDYTPPNHSDMFRSYLTIAFRNLLRQKAFSFINISGLAIGMACSILILLWVQDELGYDRFHVHADQLYRVICSTPDIEAAVSVAPMAQVLETQMPEIREAVRVSKHHFHLLEVGGQKFEERRVVYADSNFLEVFSFPLLKGDVRTALLRPDGVLLTEAMAKKYFGGEEALGKTIRKDNREVLTVTGVLADVPTNSHLQFDFILPMALLAQTNDDLKNNSWNHFNFYTYVQLDEKVETAALPSLQKKINQLYKEHHTELKVDFQLQPLSQIYLRPGLVADVEGHGNRQYVQILSIVAVFILLVACINFMNLATARSARRAKEVGLRKVVGAGRGQLIGQFMGESVIVSFLALLLALGIVSLLLPFFNELASKQLTFHLLNERMVVGLLGIALLTGLFSGSYPALFLSGFQPVKVLKGNLKSGTGNLLFRNSLVVAQFVVSIILLVGTAAVYNQLQFIRSKNLGFEKENLLYMPMSGELWGKQPALKAALEQNSLTSEYTITQDLPTNLVNGTIDLDWEGKNPDAQPVFYSMAVDENAIDVFRMHVLAGRGFSKEFKADTANYLVNERALQTMGMKAATAVGKPLSFNGTKGTIIGVVKDFNFKPIQKAIEPLVLQLNTGGGVVVVRTRSGQTEAAIQAMEQISKQLNPTYRFAYNFLDQDLANLYRSEQQMGNLFNAFAGLAIFISCLGLYGLSAFMAEQRTREIGVRKVLGASVFNIIYLLSTTFTRLLMLAMLIAIPIAWFATNRWLEGFAYRIEVNWGIFLVTCLVTLLIAGITVSYEATKAALVNPIKSLRSE